MKKSRIRAEALVVIAWAVGGSMAASITQQNHLPVVLGVVVTVLVAALVGFVWKRALQSVAVATLAFAMYYAAPYLLH